MTTPGTSPALSGLRVVHVDSGIAGAYFGKLLADAGADVVAVEPPQGSALRRRVACGADLPPGDDGALFRYLHTSQRSVVADRRTPEGAADLDRLVAAADVVLIERDPGRDADPDLLTGWYERHPHLIAVSVSPFGLDGPLADRPWSDLVIQALSGSLGGRGDKQGAPVAAGGEIVEWAAGLTAAVAALLALRRRAVDGRGEHIDLSRLEVAVTIFNGFQSVAGQLSGAPPARPFRVVEVPSIAPAKDGWVGFCTNTMAQFAAFAEMIGRPDWASDPQLRRIDVRVMRAPELRAAIAEWTSVHTVADILRTAAERRVPCAPVGNGETAPTFAHFAERGVFVAQPGTGHRQPRVPYRLSRTPQPAFRAVPRLGTTAPADLLAQWQGERRWLGSGPRTNEPLAGVRIFDFTSFWAGPYVGQILGSFGAEVIKVESIQRPDLTRLSTSYAGVAGDRIWERSPLYHGTNSGKRCVTLDLTRPRGRELARRLLEHCDVVIENYAPRVAERFGLLDGLADRTIVVRMPAWGVDGPWRDRPGFAQNMEQVTGLAWVTGFPDDAPLVPRGPCDPIGGMHATLAALVAILDRDRTGLGQLIEATLVEPALNVAAEQFVEYAAYGRVLERIGNRSRWIAPQNVYRCKGDDDWVAISVAADDQWSALRAALGDPPALRDPRYDSVEGRLRHADEIDAEVAAWCADRTANAVETSLRERGVPAAEMVLPRGVGDSDQLRHRGYFETVVHPVVGPVDLPGFAARFGSDDKPFHTAPAPLLGQDNHDVLGHLLGLSDDEIAELAREGIIGDAPAAAGSAPAG